MEFSLDHIWSLLPLSITVPFPFHCIFPSQLSSLIFHHLLEMNKRGMISAAAHSHLLVQPRSLVPLALPVDPAYSRCVQFFPGHSPKLPLYYFFRFKFLLIFSISISVSHLFVRICLAWSANLCSVTGKALIHPIFSLFFVYIFFLWAHSLSNTHLQSCLLPFPTSFSLSFDPLLDDDLQRPDQVPHACLSDTFTTSSSKSR